MSPAVVMQTAPTPNAAPAAGGAFAAGSPGAAALAGLAQVEGVPSGDPAPGGEQADDALSPFAQALAAALVPQPPQGQTAQAAAQDAAGGEAQPSAKPPSDPAAGLRAALDAVLTADAGVEAPAKAPSETVRPAEAAAVPTGDDAGPAPETLAAARPAAAGAEQTEARRAAQTPPVQTAPAQAEQPRAAEPRDARREGPAKAGAAEGASRFAEAAAARPQTFAQAAVEDALAEPAGAPAPVEADAPDAPAPAARTAEAPQAAPVQAPAVPAAAGAAERLTAVVRAGVQTIERLAEQIVRRMDGGSTRFELALSPEGLGRVEVKVEIDRAGAVSAALAFDNPVAQAELRARAEELRGALAQAGFDLSDSGLSFELGRRGADPEDRGPASDSAAGHAFRSAADAAETLLDTVTEAALRLARGTELGLDIRI